MPIFLTIDFQPQKLFNSLHDLIRMAFPAYELKEGKADQNDGYIAITSTEFADQVLFAGSIRTNDNTTEDRQYYPITCGDVNRNVQIKRSARIFIYHMLCHHLEKDINDYGILTGVRPVKIVHRLLDEGLDTDSIFDSLANEYLISSEKAHLLVDVASNNRPFLLSASEARKRISIYIGIPFCPSRCYYCSFPGAIPAEYESEISPFMEALIREMNEVGDYIKHNHLSVETIYIGGGTPTVLNVSDLSRIFEVLHRQYISGATVEVTVEAGRPDTLSPSMVSFIKQSGVNRICINPQSMNDETLRLIGRKHDSQAVIEAVEWARSVGIKHINMDLIVGLPGENIEGYLNTAEKVVNLKPENVTVHTLAVKRGSLMAENEARSRVLSQVAEVERGLNAFAEILSHDLYVPYYLYRQKYMQAPMENTGYSIPGCFCLYNIQMIEERQTILGLGGGASSKFVNAADWSLVSLHNPKHPRSYCQTVESLIARKVDKLRALN